MSPLLIRLLFGLFFIAHGLIHISLTTVPISEPGAVQTPYWPSLRRQNIDPRWLANRLHLSKGTIRILGWVLCAVATAGFILAGLGILHVPGLSTIWIQAATFCSVVSMVLLLLFWHPWFVAGPLINVAIIALIQFQWPAALFVQQ